MRKNILKELGYFLSQPSFNESVLNRSDERRPRISVVTPSLNQGKYLERTILSTLNQNYPNLEYIIIDGGSNDNSVQIIKKYQKLLKYWVSEPDHGQSHAINKGFEHATGELMIWLNSDDFFMPGSFSHIVEVYRQNPKAVAWVGACYRMDQMGNVLNTIIPWGLNRDKVADWAYGGFFCQPSCFFSARAWKEVQPLNEKLYCAFDLDLWLKLLKLGLFVSTSNILSVALIHGQAKTQAQRMKMHAETIGLQVNLGYLDIAARRLERLRQNFHEQRMWKTRLLAWIKNVMVKH